jgi:hypothetical protein
MLQHAILLVAVIILGRWAWRYLTKRLQTQIFVVLTAASCVIFIATIVSFTFLLMSRVQAQAFTSLQTTANVLNYAIAGKLAETTATAQAVAQDTAVTTALAAEDRATLNQLLGTFLATKNYATLVLTNDNGDVVWRAEDPGRHGDSLGDDTLIARAAVGETATGLAAIQTPKPQLLLKTTLPARDASGAIIGTVSAGMAADNTFVDSIQSATGLVTAMYAGSTQTATTLRGKGSQASTSTNRTASKTITNTVLDDGKVWTGRTADAGQTYIAVYLPLRDADNVPIGMLYVGQPQVETLQTAGRSIEVTFLIAVLLLLATSVPIYAISRYLAKQLH